MPRNQIRLFATVFAVIIALLIGIYFLFLRPSYAPLFNGIRQADTAAIIGELDKQGISYRLADGGSTILVPENDVEQARVKIAGSGLPMAGTVGFELFNESDMGLTEFAQKINYLRALQGELARTIMSMDEVREARVHISLPQRALFQKDSSVPRAAVTIHTMHEAALSEDQVQGIQRLVAAAVPDMNVNSVTVLDHLGQLVSKTYVANSDITGGTDEHSALETYFGARVSRVLRGVVSLPFEVDVVAFRTASDGNKDSQSSDVDGADLGDSRTMSIPRSKDFRFRITVWTQQPLEPGVREDVRHAVASDLDADFGGKDEIDFSERPLGEGLSAAVGRIQSPSAGHESNREMSKEGIPAVQVGRAMWVAAALAMALLTFFLIVMRRGTLSKDDREQFAELLKRELARDREVADGAA
ncbi:flagellar basal-body MS-ring/collar protein FliF [Novosphingobium beihaiensis]|uniref:Flagellar M-ring protein FliF n=1 Tax=Novosphingobium beihaiensis TaxID=2930389 RepID=A0ABT0BQ82_9SPHN|nr:flagellar basal-body MS-ring/collar protein FliF [Novosphingobium beihaiensis]MCJ2186991.1 flagellar M-ring protein FliF [Novosphingobium beihaiensis]